MVSIFKKSKASMSTEKDLICKELDLYRKEKILEIDREVEDYRIKRNKEVQDIAKRCHEELGRYEHDYHYSKEQKGIEISKLEARIEALKEVVMAREEVVKADNNLLKSKDNEIKRLNDIITLFIKEQPKHVSPI